MHRLHGRSKKNMSYDWHPSQKMYHLHVYDAIIIAIMRINASRSAIWPFYYWHHLLHPKIRDLVLVYLELYISKPKNMMVISLHVSFIFGNDIKLRLIHFSTRVTRESFHRASRACCYHDWIPCKIKSCKGKKLCILITQKYALDLTVMVLCGGLLWMHFHLCGFGEEIFDIGPV